MHPSPVRKLLAKGVHIPAPDQIFIAEEVMLDRIAPGVVLHPGARIYGANTFLGENTILGEEGPLVLRNVLTGKNVRLKGGSFQDAVFLEGASAGPGSHVRGGTILEEGASIAHAVGLKQTILFPWVTLGSLINFCDVFMSGGTGPKDHSEVGSSYIHFNFTPDQDKATPSLLGDVPSGVMLDQPPIFLGGQGGLVGPCRLSFGTVLAAGSIQRKDEKRKNRLIFGASLPHGNIERKTALYPGIKRILENNFLYLANLQALKVWYQSFRKNLVSPSFPEELLSGLVAQVRAGMDERSKRLRQLSEKIFHSPFFSSMGKKDLHRQWVDQAPLILPLLAAELEDSGNYEIKKLQEAFFKGLSFRETYLETIGSLDEVKKNQGRKWLAAIVDHYCRNAWDTLTG